MSAIPLPWGTLHIVETQNQLVDEGIEYYVSYRSSQDGRWYKINSKKYYYLYLIYYHLTGIYYYKPGTRVYLMPSCQIWVDHPYPDVPGIPLHTLYYATPSDRVYECFDDVYLEDGSYTEIRPSNDLIGITNDEMKEILLNKYLLPYDYLESPEEYPLYYHYYVTLSCIEGIMYGNSPLYSYARDYIYSTLVRDEKGLHQTRTFDEMMQDFLDDFNLWIPKVYPAILSVNGQEVEWPMLLSSKYPIPGRDPTDLGGRYTNFSIPSFAGSEYRIGFQTGIEITPLLREGMNNIEFEVTLPATTYAKTETSEPQGIYSLYNTYYPYGLYDYEYYRYGYRNYNFDYSADDDLDFSQMNIEVVPPNTFRDVCGLSAPATIVDLDTIIFFQKHQPYHHDPIDPL